MEISDCDCEFNNDCSLSVESFLDDTIMFEESMFTVDNCLFGVDVEAIPIFVVTDGVCDDIKSINCDGI